MFQEFSGHNLNDHINEIVNKTVDLYLDQISNLYNIPKEKLLSVWNDEKPAQKKSVSPEILAAHLATQTKLSLIDMCKARGLRTTGAKVDLIERVIEFDTGKKPTPASTSPVSPKPKINSPKFKTPDIAKTQVVKKLIKPHVPVIEFRRNKFNKYEHSETGLVLDQASQKIIGRQNHETGELKTLTPDDIDKCKMYKFSYIIPDNLDTNIDDDEEEETTEKSCCEEDDTETGVEDDPETGVDASLDDDEEDDEEFPYDDEE